jgi:hypothetical protein
VLLVFASVYRSPAILRVFRRARAPQPQESDVDLPRSPARPPPILPPPQLAMRAELWIEALWLCIDAALVLPMCAVLVCTAYRLPNLLHILRQRPRAGGSRRRIAASSRDWTLPAADLDATFAAAVGFGKAMGKQAGGARAALSTDMLAHRDTLLELYSLQVGRYLGVLYGT